MKRIALLLLALVACSDNPAAPARTPAEDLAVAVQRVNDVAKALHQQGLTFHLYVTEAEGKPITLGYLVYPK